MDADPVLQPFRVLIVDDNTSLAESAKVLLEISRGVVDIAGTAAGALKRLEQERYDLALIDLMLPDGSGVDILNAGLAGPETRFVLMTGHPRLFDAAKAQCPRGTSFLQKPFSARDLMECFQHVLPQLGDGDEREPQPDAFGGWVGSSVAMTRLKEQLRAVAPLKTTVFLLGESGTGKELAAEAVHRLSGRSGPFLTVNCGAIPESLIANELFGHEKGSYTGANKAQAGLFERAEGGTVFLDEVTELPVEHQPHLLRVLETRSVMRIGGSKSTPIDVRVVAASNRVDEPLVANKVLREDLFYRLMVFPIVLPPLRERAEDIPELVESVLASWNREHGSSVTCTSEVIEALQQHAWPGNVRELKHTVQRLAILSNGTIKEPPDFLEHFAGASAGNGTGVPVGTSIRELERRLILATLEHFDGDRGRTAATLGISQKTLYNRLKTYEQEGSWQDSRRMIS